MHESYVSRYGELLAHRDGGWFCHYCHIQISRLPDLAQGIRRATVDHRVAKVNGGRDEDITNMLLCCDVCNRRKSEMSYRAFMSRTANHRRKRRKKSKL